MKVLLFHLTGNANVKAALNGFADAGILHKFYVCIAAIPGSILHKIGTIDVFSEIRRRSFNTRLRPFLRTWPWLEIGRLVANKSRLKIFSKQRQGLFHVDSVVQNLDKHVAKSLKSASKKGLHAVYGYEDTTIHSFREAKRIGLQCLYDLPIGYWRTAHRLLQAERHRWPEWAPTMGGLNDWEEKLLRKEEELQMADKIFVASTFTANSLKEFPGKLAPVYVIPYGFPPVSNENRQYESFKNGRSLKLLFVGSLSQRKGIADLFSVVKDLGDKVELTVVGTRPMHACNVLDNALAENRYIPTLPHNEILQLMREHDVFVFPSLFEGFGLVITEAMSQGTPVITTDRTAGPDLIEHDKNGWLIEAGSTIALKNAIEKLLLNPDCIAEVGRAAMATAKLRPWEVYGKELAEAVKS